MSGLKTPLAAVFQANFGLVRRDWRICKNRVLGSLGGKKTGEGCFPENFFWFGLNFPSGKRRGARLELGICI